MSFEAFLWSLTQQESGGNYGAVGPWVNGDRAYGRYQVMGANVPGWTAKYYGKRLTPQQYLHNRAAQDAVVRGVLGGYYRKYGARGAASMWYSGQPNWRKTYGNPPVRSYVNSVVSRMSRYSGQSTAASGGGPTSFSAAEGWSPKAVKTKLDERTLADMYGLSYALVNSDKELKKLFKKAVAGSWSAARFQASLKNTNWWKKQSKTLREYLVLKYTDPSTWKANRQNAMAEINRMAVEVGLASQLKSKIGDHTKLTGLLKDAVYNKLALGWTDARLKDWLGAHASVHGGMMWGEAGQAFDKLHEIAYMNGMQYKDWYELAARNIVSGKSTLEREEAKIRRDAAATYSAFADQIKAGQNVLDLASPYIKSVSQILEVPDSTVDLFSKYVHNAMTSTDPTPLWKFETTVRNDPRWKKTNNARESIMGVAHQVARDFGMAT